MTSIFKYLLKGQQVKAFAFYIFTVTLICSFTSIDWQGVKPEDAATELLSFNKKVIAVETYSFNVRYQSYQGHDESTVYEGMNGIVIRDKNKLFSLINGALTIQNDKVRIVVDSAKKLIKISNPVQGLDPNFNISDYIKAINVCKAIKRKEINSDVAYRFEPKASKGIVAQEIYLGESFLKKSVIFYANDYNIRKDNKIISTTVYPRLEIEILNFKKLERVNKNLFSTDDYLVVTKNEVKLKEKYKNYKYFDGRFKK